MYFQALKILRSAEYAPYVVFIASPCLQTIQVQYRINPGKVDFPLIGLNSQDFSQSEQSSPRLECYNESGGYNEAKYTYYISEEKEKLVIHISRG